MYRLLSLGIPVRRMPSALVNIIVGRGCVDCICHTLWLAYTQAIEISNNAIGAHQSIASLSQGKVSAYLVTD